MCGVNMRTTPGKNCQPVPSTLVIIIVLLVAPHPDDGLMSAPAEIMFRKRSVTRPAKLVGAWFKSLFIKLYVALDKSQRKRAAEIIRRYGHLIPDRDDSSGEQK